MAWAIITNLKNPHIIALQEICDDSGRIDDGTTSAQANAQKLIDEIQSNGGPQYYYVEISPHNNRDGGKRGSNIRCGFLYRPDRVELVRAQHKSDDTQPVAEIVHADNQLKLRYANPSLIAPHDEAFIDSRKPLVGQFRDKITSENYFITNVHLTSNGFVPNATPEKASPNAAPWEVNQVRLNKRERQAEIVAQFVGSIHNQQPPEEKAEKNHIIVCGDFNAANRVVREGAEQPVNTETLDILKKAGLIDAEQGKLRDAFSVGHSQDAMTIDYIFVSPELQSRLGEIKRPTFTKDARGMSDHNPTVLCINAPNKAIRPENAPAKSWRR